MKNEHELGSDQSDVYDVTYLNLDHEERIVTGAITIVRKRSIRIRRKRGRRHLVALGGLLLIALVVGLGIWRPDFALRVLELLRGQIQLG